MGKMSISRRYEDFDQKWHKFVSEKKARSVPRSEIYIFIELYKDLWNSVTKAWENKDWEQHVELSRMLWSVSCCLRQNGVNVDDISHKLTHQYR